MSWSRYSKLGVVLLLLVTAVAPAAAISTKKDGVPGESRVGGEVSAKYTFTDLYTEYESWTLNGQTNLTDVTWTVRKLDAAGNQLSQSSYDGPSFNDSITIENDTVKVVVKVRGTTPAVSNYTYQPPQRYQFARFQLLREGGAQQVIASDQTHHFTNESSEARTQIDEAKRAIEAAAGNEQAQKTLDNAISAYNNENFANAIDLANQAEQRAQKSQQSQNRMQLLIYGAIGVLALLVLGGGVYYWRSQQEEYDKLR